MRYTRKGTGDWVEFKTGVGKLAMTKAMQTSTMPSALAEWVDKCEFRTTDETEMPNGEGKVEKLPAGSLVSPTTGAEIMARLNFQQWDWLSNRFVEWARDDVLDPEA